MAAPLKRRPTVELRAHGTGRNRTTRSWAVKYLNQCLCPTAADPGAQHVASAMQYLAQPWFLHQRAVLGLTDGFIPRRAR